MLASSCIFKAASLLAWSSVFSVHSIILAINTPIATIAKPMPVEAKAILRSFNAPVVLPTTVA